MRKKLCLRHAFLMVVGCILCLGRAEESIQNKDDAINESIHVFVLTDRILPTQTVLNSVCKNTNRFIMFHVVVPDRRADEVKAILPDGCREKAALETYLESEMIKSVHSTGLPITWEIHVPKTKNTVHLAEWDYSLKHKSQFNHLRFYLPVMSEFADLDDIIFLDDDIILQGDIEDLWNYEQGDAGLSAGCLNWVWNDCGRMEASYTLSYLEVPYFGFGGINDRRSIHDATCQHDDEKECAPPSFFETLANASSKIKGSDAMLNISRLSQLRAFNFGLNKFRLDIWRKFNYTQRYLDWVQANANYGWFSETSLAYGLGLPFLALADSVQCMDQHGLSVLHGLGFVEPDDLEISLGDPVYALPQFYALHWNGDKKPWRPDAAIEAYAGPYMNMAPLEITQEFENRQQVTPKKSKHFVVWTAPRSGSEWFMSLLDSHPKICASGESDSSGRGWPREALLPREAKQWASVCQPKSLCHWSIASRLLESLLYEGVGGSFPHASCSAEAIHASRSGNSTGYYGYHLETLCAILDRAYADGNDMNSVMETAFRVFVEHLLNANDDTAGNIGLGDEADQVKYKLKMPCRCPTHTLATGTKIMNGWFSTVRIRARQLMLKKTHGTRVLTDALAYNGTKKNHVGGYELTSVLKSMDTKVIILDRTNLLSSYVSLRIGQISKQFHCTGQSCTFDTKAYINMDRLLQFIRMTLAQRAARDAMLEKNKFEIIRVNYETCAANTSSCIAKVLNFLDIEDLVENDGEASKIRKRFSDTFKDTEDSGFSRDARTLADRIYNYEEVALNLIKAGFGSYVGVEDSSGDATQALKVQDQGEEDNGNATDSKPSYIHLAVFSERVRAISITLTSVCTSLSTKEKEALFLYLVVPDAEQSFNYRDATHECTGARLEVITLTQFTDRVLTIKGIRNPPKFTAIPTEKALVFARFYAPAVLFVNEPSARLFVLDDDVILQGSISAALEASLIETELPVLASCQSWDQTKESTVLIKEETSMFTSETDRIASDINCRLFNHCDDKSDTKKRASTAWQSGLISINLDLWRQKQLSLIYHEWVSRDEFKNVAQYHALHGFVRCWDAQVTNGPLIDLIQGLGSVKAADASLFSVIKGAFGLHFDGELKPWLPASPFNALWQQYENVYNRSLMRIHPSLPGQGMQLPHVHVALFSDRSAAAAVTVASICANTAELNRLYFHMVVPDAETHPSWTLPEVVAHTCQGATFSLRSLADIEADIEQVTNQPVIWSNFNTNQGKKQYARDRDHKHLSPFNLLRFYVPIIPEYTQVSHLFLLDDDVIIQGDLVQTADELLEKQTTDVALLAGCQSWRIVETSFDDDSSQNYVADKSSISETSSFGFRPVRHGHSYTDAKCRSADDINCMPSAFPELLDIAATDVSCRLDSDQCSGQKFVIEKIADRTAWNFGLAAIDIHAWRQNDLTSKYTEWILAAERYELFPPGSLAHGLGLAFIALDGNVECWEDVLMEKVIVQGLGYVPNNAVAAANVSIELAFALHFNGNIKPWLETSSYIHLWQQYETPRARALLTYTDEIERRLDEGGEDVDPYILNQPVPLPTPQPTIEPTASPSIIPFPAPTPVPTSIPIPAPTIFPTPLPTALPNPTPTPLPIPAPTARPTGLPVPQPTLIPEPSPTLLPNPIPTPLPIPFPTNLPIPVPTSAPSHAPTPVPSPAPTPDPTPSPTPPATPAPTPEALIIAPEIIETLTPTSAPTERIKTDFPTTEDRDTLGNILDRAGITLAPTSKPSLSPSPAPSLSPSPAPTRKPSDRPTRAPTPKPTPMPTGAPTPKPTSTPTFAPTPKPTLSGATAAPIKDLDTAVVAPTPVPTPALSPAPTSVPSPSPTSAPSLVPTPATSPAPTTAPSPAPTPVLSLASTPAPSPAPTLAPTHMPSPAPTPIPTPEAILGNELAPSQAPALSPAPTLAPTPVPSPAATPAPTAATSATVPTPAGTTRAPVSTAEEISIVPTATPNAAAPTRDCTTEAPIRSSDQTLADPTMEPTPEPSSAGSCVWPASPSATGADLLLLSFVMMRLDTCVIFDGSEIVFPGDPYGFQLIFESSTEYDFEISLSLCIAAGPEDNSCGTHVVDILDAAVTLNVGLTTITAKYDFSADDLEAFGARDDYVINIETSRISNGRRLQSFFASPVFLDPESSSSLTSEQFTIGNVVTQSPTIRMPISTAAPSIRIAVSDNIESNGSNDRNSSNSSGRLRTQSDCWILLGCITIFSGLLACIILFEHKRDQGYCLPLLSAFLLFCILDAGFDGLFICFRRAEKQRLYFYIGIALVVFRTLMTLIITFQVQRQSHNILDRSWLFENRVSYAIVLILSITHSPWLLTLLCWSPRLIISSEASALAIPKLRLFLYALILVCVNSLSLLILKVAFSFQQSADVSSTIGAATNMIVLLFTIWMIIKSHPFVIYLDTKASLTDASTASGLEAEADTIVDLDLHGDDGYDDASLKAIDSTKITFGENKNDDQSIGDKEPSKKISFIDEDEHHTISIFDDDDDDDDDAPNA